MASTSESACCESLRLAPFKLNGQRDSASVADQMALTAQFCPVGWIVACLLPQKLPVPSCRPPLPATNQSARLMQMIGSVKWIITNIFDTENAARMLLNVIRIIGRGLFHTKRCPSQAIQNIEDRLS